MARTIHHGLIVCPLRDWIFIADGNSLQLKLDGEAPVSLAGSGSVQARSVISSNDLQEIALYELTPAQLRRLSIAKTIDFRLLGTNQTVTGTWKDSLMADAAAMDEKAHKP